MKGRRGVLIGVGVAALLVAGLYLAAGSWAGLDGLRTDYLAQNHLARAFEASQTRPLDRDAMLTHVRRALELAPEDPMVLKAAPGMLIEAGAYREALAQLNALPGPDPYLLGMCLIRTGDINRGVALLTATLETTRDLYMRQMLPDRAYALQLNNVGYVLADAGVRLNEARHMLQLAATMLPLDANVIDSLGWLYYRLGEDKLALFYLERAARHAKGSGQAEITYHLGAAYAREGKTRRARKMLLEALRLDPGHPDVEMELKRLGWGLPGPDYACRNRPVPTPDSRDPEARTEDTPWTRNA